MYTYFKMLHEVCGYSDVESIYDITKEMADLAGYHRDIFTFKNGNKRERTFYKTSFDSKLVAKWMCYYEPLFKAKLNKHHNLKEYYIDIINITFSLFMSSLNLEKTTCDAMVSKYVNLTLRNRIGYFEYVVGSVTRVGDTLSKKSKTARLCSSINHQAVSLDELILNENYSFIDNSITDNFEGEDIVIELKEKLNGSKIGMTLLQGLLNSNKKVQLSHIDDFIDLSNYKMDNKDRKELLDSYNIIKSVLHSYVLDSKYDWRPAKKLRLTTD